MALIQSDLWFDVDPHSTGAIATETLSNNNVVYLLDSRPGINRQFIRDNSFTGWEYAQKEANAINGKTVISSIGKKANLKLDLNENFPDLSQTGGTVYLVALQSKTNAVGSNYDSGMPFIVAGDSRNINIRRGDNTVNNLDCIQAGIATQSTAMVQSASVLAEDTFYCIRLRFDPVAGKNYIAINNGAETEQIAAGQAYVPVPLEMFRYGNKKIARLLVYTANHSKPQRDTNEAEIKALYGFAYNVDPVVTITTQIGFPAIPGKTLGDADFEPAASSNNPSTDITYTSSNTAVATIVNGLIHLVGAGTATITASQAALPGYTAATATQTLVVSTLTTTSLNFPAISAVIIGSPDFSPGATSNSQAQINYSTSNAAVAAIINGKIHLVGIGTATITASQAATTGFTAAGPVSQVLTVNAAVIQNTTTTSGKPAGLWFIDGIDLFQVFSILINEGTAELLKIPGRKESATHDWADSNGLDIDVSRIFLKERRFVLEMSILAKDEDEFWKKHSQFITNLIQPGLRRMEFATHNNRSYFVVYDDNNSYKQITKLQAIKGSRLVAHSFNLSFIEPDPRLDSGNVFIVSDDGRFIIT